MGLMYILALGVVALVLYIIVEKFMSVPKKKPPVKIEVPVVKKKTKQKKIDITANLKNSGKGKRARGNSVAEHVEEHPLLRNTLRGHSEDINGVAVSADGTLLASVSSDRTLKVWNISDPSAKKIAHVRVKLKLDHATAVAFSHDGKYVALALAGSKQLQFYGIKSKGEMPSLTLLHEFETHHTEEIKTVAFGLKSAFVLTCGSGQDLSVKLWTPRGVLLKTINTKQLRNNQAAVSPDGRFIAVATMLTDVKVWKVSYSKLGAFDSVELKCSLKGHRRGVNSVGFYGPLRVATGSIDGFWRLFTLDVQLHISEEPKIVAHGKTKFTNGEVKVVGDWAEAPSKIFPVAVASGSAMQFYHSKTGDLLTSIEGAHNKDDITFLTTTNDGKYVISSGEDKAIKIWAVPSTEI